MIGGDFPGTVDGVGGRRRAAAAGRRERARPHHDGARAARAADAATCGRAVRDRASCRRTIGATCAALLEDTLRQVWPALWRRGGTAPGASIRGEAGAAGCGSATRRSALVHTPATLDAPALARRDAVRRAAVDDRGAPRDAARDRRSGARLPRARRRDATRRRRPASRRSRSCAAAPLAWLGFAHLFAGRARRARRSTRSSPAPARSSSRRSSRELARRWHAVELGQARRCRDRTRCSRSAPRRTRALDRVHGRVRSRASAATSRAFVIDARRAAARAQRRAVATARSIRPRRCRCGAARAGRRLAPARAWSRWALGSAAPRHPLHRRRLRSARSSCSRGSRRSAAPASSARRAGCPTSAFARRRSRATVPAPGSRMSRAIQVRVSESVVRTVHVEDGVQSPLEMLPILAPRAHGRSARRRARGARLRARRHDTRTRTDRRRHRGHRRSRRPRRSRVKLGADDEAARRRRADRARRRRAPGADRGAPPRRGASASSTSASPRRTEALRREVTKQLEKKLGDLRKELDGAVGRATVAALTERAGQLGAIQEVSGDEAGNVTIRVKL